MVIGRYKILEKKVIGSPDDPLLVRYIIFRCPAFGVFIHHMYRSDYDRAIHNHPWQFVSVVLKGGYTEIHDQTIDGSQTSITHKPGSVLVRPAEWRHRFCLPIIREMATDGMVVYQKSITLVIVGRRTQKWGFFTDRGWCWWRKYDTRNNICSEEVLWEGGDD